MIIGYQGLECAYSEQALLQTYSGATAVAYESFEDVFAALGSKRVDLAFIPVENSIAGSVVENFDLLFSEDVQIEKEVFYKIRHALLGVKGSEIDNISEAFSHHMALRQCKAFLKANSIVPVQFIDTAGAAEMISKQTDNTKAAIASELCADIYGLEVLKNSIETDSSNTTRFFSIKKRNECFIESNKMSIAFKTKHYPGALIDCLKVFQWYDLNLTKIESRPIPDRTFEYVFYVDFEGDYTSAQVQKAIGELEGKALFLKVLGAY